MKSVKEQVDTQAYVQAKVVTDLRITAAAYIHGLREIWGVVQVKVVDVRPRITQEINASAR